MSAEPMITRSGRVVRVDGDRLTVRFERQSACVSCRAAKACAGNTPSSEIELERPPGLHYRVGDEVRVGLAEHNALRATLAAYLIPLAGFVLAMLLGAALGLPDAAVLAASLCGLGGGLLALRRLARRPGLQLQPMLLDTGNPPFPEEIHP